MPDLWLSAVFFPTKKKITPPYYPNSNIYCFIHTAVIILGIFGIIFILLHSVNFMWDTVLFYSCRIIFALSLTCPGQRCLELDSSLSRSALSGVWLVQDSAVPSLTHHRCPELDSSLSRSALSRAWLIAVLDSNVLERSEPRKHTGFFTNLHNYA